MVEYIPESCQCQNTDAGATAICTVDAGGYDTINVQFDMNVCAEPLLIDIKMWDDLTSFEYSIEEGDTGEIMTGISLGIPAVGSADIYLTYTLSGNIDELYMQFGFDLGVTFPIYGTTYCKDTYPDKCPYVFLDTTMSFGDECSA